MRHYKDRVSTLLPSLVIALGKVSEFFPESCCPNNSHLGNVDKRLIFGDCFTCDRVLASIAEVFNVYVVVFLLVSVGLDDMKVVGTQCWLGFV